MSLFSSERRASTDFLIADMQMPGMKWLELHLTLRSAKGQIPTIPIRGLQDEPVRSQALKAGVLLCSAKPFCDDDMIGCIRLVVAQREIGGGKHDFS